MVTVVEYTPRGIKAYTCSLVTPGGGELTIRSIVVSGETEVSGSGSAEGNATLANLLRAYGAHEFQFRRLRASEKRASHRKQADKHLADCKALGKMVDRVGTQTRSGWCSACLSLSEHTRLTEGTRGSWTYLCSTCGGPTVACAVPRCHNFASRGFRAVRSAKFCAEHRHEIPAFSRLDQSLKRIEDYAHWLEHDKPNASRITKTASAVVVGGAVLAPLAFVAAPAIGGAVGTTAASVTGAGGAGGLYGAAASSYGLALLGGGSLATGGLGMAGGTMVVTALGGGLGTALGAVTSTAYVNSDPSFKIQKLRDGDGTPVLFATGFMTEGNDGWAGWDRLIDTRYPEAPVYRVLWGAKELTAFAWAMGEEAGRRVSMAKAMFYAAKATKAGAKKLGPIGAAFLASGLVRNPWSVARARAEMTGAVLADIIARTEQAPFILMGHSLGGRVMVSAAQILGTRDDAPKIEAIHLLGAAVSRGGDWRTLGEAVQERVWNYHSRNDQVLALAYRGTALGREAIGRLGLESKFPKITDRDVTQKVAGHTKYVANVKLSKPRA